MLLIVFFLGLTVSEASKYRVTTLSEEKSKVKCCDTRISEIEIYCYEGKPKHIFYLWETVQLHLSISPDKYERYDGFTPEEVYNQYEKDGSSWSFNFFPNRRRPIRLDPFNRTCTGVKTNHDYNIAIDRIRVDFGKVFLMLIGLTLFLAASKLSSNSLFYYLTGISFGTLASTLIAVYIIGRMFPKKPIMYSFVAGGWTVGLYLAQIVFDNIRTIAIQYKTYVIYYFITTSLISFIFCYRYGPVSDPKSKNLIKWALQAVGLALIFTSSDIPEVSMGIILILLMLYNAPLGLINQKIKKMVYRFKPIKPRFLTEDEYHQQGAVETEKALDSLRGYCSSPECNQWKTVLKLKDPVRFAQFMGGKSHLKDDEVLAFNTEDNISEDSDSNEILTEDSSG